MSAGSLSGPQVILLRLARKGQYYLKGAGYGPHRAGRKRTLAGLLHAGLLASPAGPNLPHTLTAAGLRALDSWEANHQSQQVTADTAAGMVE